jgi:DNA polymerase-3 subunit beta
MKFRVEREVLAEALGAAARVASTRNNAMPALSGAKLEVKGDLLTLTCTDNDLSIEFEISVGGQRDGVLVASAKLLSDIVRSVDDGKVTVELTGEEVNVSADRSQFNIPTFVVSDFPQVTKASAPPVKIYAPAFAEALRQVVRAASNDLQRLPLTGVLLAHESDGLRLVATDSYRLAVKTMANTFVLGDGQPVVIPSRALGELQRLLGTGDEATLYLAADRATFSVGSATLSTSLLAVEFPKYQQLIAPSYPNTLTTAREPLLEAIRRCRVVARDNTPVRLEMSNTSLRLEVVTPDLSNASASVTLDAALDGTEMTIGFNPDFFAQGVEAVAGDEVTIETSDPHKPAVIKGVGSNDYLYLLMPQRLNG